MTNLLDDFFVMGNPKTCFICGTRVYLQVYTQFITKVYDITGESVCNHCLKTTISGLVGIQKESEDRY